MFSKVTREEGPPTLEKAGLSPEGRFVLHRHTDAQGDHLDLRLERDGYLLGWRIDGTDLCDGPWASEKGPHPVRWLDESADAIRVDAGVYAWERFDTHEVVLILQNDDGCTRLHIENMTAITPSAARAIGAALIDAGASPLDAAKLIADGATSRARAIERLCGLGRELDSSAFDGELWRRSLADMTLDEIHSQLRAFETRFDRRHPPSPISQPEALPEDEASERSAQALTIATT